MELVAQGLTNPQIADRMFISRATVKVQVAFIFQKLDISNRAELTAKQYGAKHKPRSAFLPSSGPLDGLASEGGK